MSWQKNETCRLWYNLAGTDSFSREFKKNNWKINISTIQLTCDSKSRCSCGGVFLVFIFGKYDN